MAAKRRKKKSSARRRPARKANGQFKAKRRSPKRRRRATTKRTAARRTTRRRPAKRRARKSTARKSTARRRSPRRRRNRVAAPLGVGMRKVSKTKRGRKALHGPGPYKKGGKASKKGSLVATAAEMRAGKPIPSTPAGYFRFFGGNGDLRQTKMSTRGGKPGRKVCRR